MILVNPWTRRSCWCAAALVLLLAAGCSALSPTATTRPPGLFALNLKPDAARAAANPASAPTLVVTEPRAAAGFDSPRIIYLREAHRLQYFANSEWVDAPARMLAPLLVAALDGGAFRAVWYAPSAARGDWRLDTELVQLQHEFATQPSQVRLVLRAYLVDDATRRVLASRQFEAVVAAASEDPYGGVIAANQAVRKLLLDLAAFCDAEVAAQWVAKATDRAKIAP